VQKRCDYYCGRQELQKEPNNKVVVICDGYFAPLVAKEGLVPVPLGAAEEYAAMLADAKLRDKKPAGMLLHHMLLTALAAAAVTKTTKLMRHDAPRRR